MPKGTPSRTTPPRPMNCFLLYRNDMQKEIVAKCKGANHRDISKIIAKWWNDLDAEVKNAYRIKAMKEKEEHQKKYPDYKYCPKKKIGKKRSYTRRNAGTIFTSRTEKNNRLMESMYKCEGTPIVTEIEELPPTVKVEEVPPTVKIEEKDFRALLIETAKGNSLSPPAHDSRRRSRHSSAPLVLSSQDSLYTRNALSPEYSFSSSSSSVGCGSPFKSPSSPASFHAVPYMQPIISSFNTISHEFSYYVYYDPTCHTYVYYNNQNYMQPLHQNIGNSSTILFANHSASQYITPSAAYHASLNYVQDRSSYASPISTVDYEYEKESDGCINPLLLGMP